MSDALGTPQEATSARRVDVRALREDHVRQSARGVHGARHIAPPAHVAQNPFLNILWRRMHRHRKNVVVAITGESGSGKSYAGLRLGETLDPEFTVEEVHFDPGDLLRGVRARPPRRGKFQMYDEGGVGSHNRDWRNYANTALIHLLQTWRVFGEALAITVPDPRFLDPQVWALCQYWIAMDPLRPGVSVIKRIEPHPEIKGRPIFYPLLRVPLPDGEIARVSPVTFGLPSPRLAEPYERAAWDWKLNKQSQLIATLDKHQHHTDPTGNMERVLQEVKERMTQDPALYRKSLKKGGAKLNVDTLRYDLKHLTVDEFRAVAGKLREHFGL